MKIQANLLDKSLAYKISVLIILSLLGFLLTSAIASTIILLLNNKAGVTNLLNANSMSVTQMLFIQTFSVTGMFIIPSLICNKLFGLGVFKPKPNFKLGVIAIFIVIAALPFVNWLAAFNSKMELPNFLSNLELWMRENELKAEFLTKKILSVTSIKGLLLNIAVVAVIAAISEELFFRGMFQNMLSKHKINIHVAIWLSAILFSAIHLQFYGFIPRMLLGGILGYIYFWSGSVWLPIIAHFTNNFIGVCLGFAIAKGSLHAEIESFGKQGFLFPFLSLLVFTSLLYYFYKLATQK